METNGSKNSIDNDVGSKRGRIIGFDKAAC